MSNGDFLLTPEEYQAKAAEHAQRVREFEIWWQSMQGIAREYGLKDDDIDEGIKYSVEIPGLADVIHLVPRAKVSPDEMKAHRAALRRGDPSPLSPAQLETLEWKRQTFLKIMASPTPEVTRNAGWYVNQVENVGDMMTAAYWGGKGILWALGKIGMKTRGPAAKYMGWALVAKDIADIINLFRIARAQRGTKKGSALKSGSMNPFSNERKLSRGFKMKARLPGVPDWIEIAQVTDQFFGVGISFGPIVGFAWDSIYGVRRGAEFKSGWGSSKSPIDCALGGFEGGCGLMLGP